MPATLDDYRWLVSDAAQPWLQRVSEELGTGACGSRSEPQPVTPALVARLRKDLFAERAHLVIEQVELRQRAREKFSLANRMYFTRKGLEQATDERLADYKASRIPAERDNILDFCCGIGGDLLALCRQRASLTVGVDSDPVCCLLAETNARVYGFLRGACIVFCTEFNSMPTHPASIWHCDPDRRIDGRRTMHVELFEPPLEALDCMLASNPNAAIKLAPATELPLAWFEAAEREWLGSRGECRQQVAWFGSLARHPGRNVATIVAGDGSSRTIVGLLSEEPPLATSLGRYLYEPHAAVSAAHVTAALCREHDLAAVSEGIGYLTGDNRLADPALAAFEVREVLPFDRKQLRAWCREHSVGRLEIKKRGVAIDPQRVRAEIIGPGDNEATLLLTPLGGHVRAIVARRV